MIFKDKEGSGWILLQTYIKYCKLIPVPVLKNSFTLTGNLPMGFNCPVVLLKTESTHLFF